ncbi:hypothetical protein ACIHQR_30325 [Corallococcus coralloides]|uniref:hypothetical protein n=1 Tax=Corallococcus coralloides TaxID=184914 RepID=UPI00384D0283
MNPDHASPERVAEKYKDHSSRVSENVRALGFGALALVWVIADQKFERLSGALVWACGFLVGAFVADFIQYVWLAQAFHWAGTKGKKVDGKNGPLVEMPGFLRRVAEGLYWIKILALLGAFAFILSALVKYQSVSPQPSNCTIPPGPKV